MHLLIQNYHFHLVFLWLKKRRGILWFMSVNGNRWFCFRTRRCQPCILGEYFVHMILITTSIPKNSLVCRENVLRHNPHFVTHPSLISIIVFNGYSKGFNHLLSPHTSICLHHLLRFLNLFACTCNFLALIRKSFSY